jgi:hypothetical protein
VHSAGGEFLLKKKHAQPQRVSVQNEMALSPMLTPVSDISNTVSVIGELFLKPPLNIVRVRVFLHDKLNDQVLLVLSLAAKNLKVQRS